MILKKPIILVGDSAFVFSTKMYGIVISTVTSFDFIDKKWDVKYTFSNGQETRDLIVSCRVVLVEKKMKCLKN